MHCGQCGQRKYEGDILCHSCGAPVQRGKTNIAKTAQAVIPKEKQINIQQHAKAKKKIYWGLVAIVFVLNLVYYAIYLAVRTATNLSSRPTSLIGISLLLFIVVVLGVVHLYFRRKLFVHNRASILINHLIATGILIVIGTIAAAIFAFWLSQGLLGLLVLFGVFFIPFPAISSVLISTLIFVETIIYIAIAKKRAQRLN